MTDRRRPLAIDIIRIGEQARVSDAYTVAIRSRKSLMKNA
jgi:hypothetical protein